MESKQSNWMIKYLGKYPIVFLVLGVLIISIAPWIFTSSAFFGTFDFSNTGNIGSTIGGITAPIVSLIGAILVYVSFLMQFEANKQLATDTRINVILKFIGTIENGINNYKYRDESSGIHSIDYFIKTLDSELGQNNSLLENIPHYRDFISIIENYVLVMYKLSSSLIDIESQNLLKEKLKIIYVNRLKISISKFENKFNDMTKRNGELYKVNSETYDRMRNLKKYIEKEFKIE